MKIEKVYRLKRYTLSNDNLKVGNKVFPIVNGRCTDNGEFILHDLDFRNFISGFPNQPHTILNLKHSDYKPQEVRTDFGYSPVECYFKIIKIEEYKVVEKKVGNAIFKDATWIEVFEKNDYTKI